MIVTKNWLNEWIDIENIPLDEVEKSLNRIGLEVDRSLKFSAPDGVVVGKIETIEQHPNADRLRVCQIDIGENAPLQIVTNDQNVKVGDFVPVATVGTHLPEFKIKKGKLRGVESFGMLCSTEEFGIPRVDEGVVILDDSIGELKVGKPLSQFPIFNDELIEIELTANRGDCLSIYGVARDLASALNLPYKREAPDIEEIEGCIKDFDYSVDYLKFSDIKRLPLKIRTRLAIVEKLKRDDFKDALQYVTHSTGVILKGVEEGEKKLSYDDGVLKIGDSQIGIYSNSSNSCIEVSYINPEVISKVVHSKKLKTDELYYNSSRGSEPSIELSISLLKELAVFENLERDNSFKNIKPKREIKISLNEINNFIGAEIEKSRVSNTLLRLGFEVFEDGKDLKLKVPKFRHDIVNTQDVIEEILRMVGIDNIPAKRLAILEKNRENTSSKRFKLKSEIRTKAVANGFYEVMTYLFGKDEIFKRYGFETLEGEKSLINPIVDTMDTLRPTVTIGLLEAVQRNINFGKKRVPLFEIGKVFSKDRDEKEVITFIFSGEIEEPSIKNSGKPDKIDFESFAHMVLSSIGGGELEEGDIVSQLQHPYQNAKVIQDGDEVGYIYKLRLDIEEEFDIPTTYIAEIELDRLSQKVREAQEYSKYQASVRDLSLVISSAMEYKEVRDSIKSLNNPLLKDFYPVDIFQLDDEKVSLTLRFYLQSMEKTLEEDDITEFVNSVLEKLGSDLGITLR